jgi:membrane-associated phospholipid phosphatase
VQLRLLARLDLAVTVAMQPLISPGLDLFSAAVGILLSGELTAVYALIAGYHLWRAGQGLWSLAPFAFGPPTLLEVVLKEVIHQPWVGSVFYRGVYYPLTDVVTPNTFPSGHAIRDGFIVVFVVLVLRARPGRPSFRCWCGTALAVGLACLLGLTRVYLGDHWLSDVIGGLLLGSATGLLAARTVAASWWQPC